MKLSNLFKSFFLALIAAMMPQLASAYDFMVDGIAYNYNNDGTSVSVSSGSDYTGEIIIPDNVTYNSTTYSVTSIGEYAFGRCSGLTSVTIGNSVTSIGNDAFWCCSGLTSVTIPNSVIMIGDNAFQDCTGLSSVTIGNSVTSIGNNAFQNCTGLSSVTIGNSVTSIGYAAFGDCSGLTSVTIPNSVIMIGERAFQNCTGLSSVTIGNSVSLIGDLAFTSCSGLTSIVVGSGNPKYDSRNNCNGIIETETNTLVFGCRATVIPNSVTVIGSYAFCDCSGLTSVTIPNSVTTIGISAFSGCSGLTSLSITNSVTEIGSTAFRGCSGLTSIVVRSGNPKYDSRNNCNAIIETETNTLVSGCKATVIPNSVTSIGSSAFSDCSGLTSITIPNSVTSIGDWAFSNCSCLTSIEIPNSVTSIGYAAFGDCSGLTSVTIPNSVYQIGSYAFYECSSLTSVTIPNSVTEIGDCAFSYCSGLTSVTIPNSVTTIGGTAFYHCSGLTSVTIPSSVTEIGSRAFANCSGLTSVTWNAKNCSYYSNSPLFSRSTSITSFVFGNEVEHIPAFLCCGLSGLTSVTIPNSVYQIGSYAFYGCSGLTSVTIPNSVTTIGESALDGCSGLTSVTLSGQGDWYLNVIPNISQLKTVNIGMEITRLGNFGFTPDVVNCYAETPPACSSSTFSSYDGSLHVPTTSIAAYFMADYWQNFNNLVNDLGKVTLDKTNANVSLWESLSLTATVAPAGDEVIWSSTNPWVATVDENGVVTATGGGECDIYATLASSHDAAYARCHITVSHADITISLSDESLEMNMGEEHNITAIITPDNGEIAPTWTSSNTSVATVDENGKVTAVGEGECDITATVLDQTATCHVTVTNNVTITLNVENAIIGASQMLTVYPSCSPDVPVELVVTSSDPSVAVARVVNRTNAPAAGLKSFPEKGMALAMMEELAAPSESKDPALASTKAIMIVGVQNGTATITVTTADGKAVPAVLELRVVDVDGDRTITASDITCLYNYLLNSDESYIATSDVDGDGFITSADITVLYNLMLGN